LRFFTRITTNLEIISEIRLLFVIYNKNCASIAAGRKKKRMRRS